MTGLSINFFLNEIRSSKCEASHGFASPMEKASLDLFRKTFLTLHSTIES